MNTCPECGAPERQCEARFHEFLALEYADSAYGAVHHLTVAAYMVQHSSNLSEDGWRFERELLRRFLDEGISPSRLRRELASHVDSGRRTFKIKSSDERPLFDRPAWQKTIMDVRHVEPQVYCLDVAAWARAVLTDTEQLRLETHEA